MPVVYAMLAMLPVTAFFAARHVPQQVAAEKTISGCSRLTDVAERRDCYSERYLEQLTPINFASSFESIESAVDDNAYGDDCHAAMHVVGRTMVKTGAAPLDLYRRSRNAYDGKCMEGFLHGVAEQALAQDVASFAVAGRLLCGGGNPSPADCYHGLGHGLTRTKGDADARASCATVRSKGLDLYCLGGLYMERAVSDDYERVRPRSICHDAPKRETYTCFEQVPEVLIDVKPEISGLELLDMCNAEATTPRALAGCAAKSAQYTDNVQQCTQLRLPVAAANCAFLTISFNKQLPDERLVTEARPCLAVEQLAYGCAAAVGSEFEQRKLPASTCSTLGVHEGACRAGYTECWPLIMDEKQTGACKTIGVPAQMRPEV